MAVVVDRVAAAEEEQVTGADGLAVPVDGLPVVDLVGGVVGESEADARVGGEGEAGAVVGGRAGGAPDVGFAELGEGEVDDAAGVAVDDWAADRADDRRALRRWVAAVVGHAVGVRLGEHFGDVTLAGVVAADRDGDGVQAGLAVAEVAAGGGDGVVGVV